MRNLLPIKQEELFNMEPEELLYKLQEYVDFPDVESIDTIEDKKLAQSGLNKAIAYTCYFREMETLARLKKRRARSKKDTKEATKLLGIEEVFESFKRISEQQYEYISKTMTLKRLGLDEAKIMSDQI